MNKTTFKAGARKTARISDLTDRVNRMLNQSVESDEARAGRVALAVLLEGVLMDADQYRGYRFTDGEQGDLDPTRRRYFLQEGI